MFHAARNFRKLRNSTTTVASRAAIMYPSTSEKVCLSPSSIYTWQLLTWVLDPPGHDYVYTEGTGLDQARGIDLDEEDPEDFRMCCRTTTKFHSVLTRPTNFSQAYPTHPPTGYEEDHDGDEDTATFDYDTREAIAQSLNQRYQSQGANQPSTSTLPNYLDCKSQEKVY